MDSPPTNKKILIVDDEEEVLDILYKKLSATGYRVIKATRGREALQKARYYFPDLILMDIILPDIEGSEVVRMFREDTTLKLIPVIFLSALAVRGAAQEKVQIQIGDREYEAISKPFQIEELLARIKEKIG